MMKSDAKKLKSVMCLLQSRLTKDFHLDLKYAKFGRSLRRMAFMKRLCLEGMFLIVGMEK